MYHNRQQFTQQFYGNPYPQQQQMYGHPMHHNQQIPPTPYNQFAKPPQPQYMMPINGQNPNTFGPGSNPPSQSSFMNYFYDDKGQIDYGKVINTVSQVAHAFQQVTPVFQQINSLINSFRT